MRVIDCHQTLQYREPGSGSCVLHLSSLVCLLSSLHQANDPSSVVLSTVRCGFDHSEGSQRPNMITNRRISEDVHWLIQMAQKRLGFEDFKGNRNRAVCNADVVKSWTFAVEFCEEYHKVPFHQV